MIKTGFGIKFAALQAGLTCSRFLIIYGFSLELLYTWEQTLFYNSCMFLVVLLVVLEFSSKSAVL